MKFSVYQNFFKKIGDVDLLKIAQEIKSGKYSEQIQEIRLAQSRNDQDLKDQLKAELMAFTPSATFGLRRQLSYLQSYNQIIHLDFDKISIENIKRLTLLVREIPETLMSFISPSGDGLKIFVRVNTNMDQHNTAYIQVQRYYESKLKINADSVCKDITRLCFFSYDQDLYYNEESSVFRVKIDQELDFNRLVNKSSSSEYLEILEKVWNNSEGKFENRNGSRNNLVHFFANNCNRLGMQVDLVIDFAKTNSELPQSEIISTIKNVYFNNKSEHNTRSISDEYSSSQVENEMPTFSGSLYDNMPDFLKKVVSIGNSSDQKDILLLSTLTVISSTISNFHGFYKDSVVHANFYAFILAKASSGKGIVNHCRRIVMPIHNELIRKSRLARNEYELELMEFDKNQNSRSERPTEPLDKKLFVPADNSSSGFLSFLNSNGGAGLMFETEADTLSLAFKKEHGNFSDAFRKAFHHESISFYRKTNKEYVNIEKPQLSVLLTGTPNQVKSLIQSAENGLLSRFVYYIMNMKIEWDNVFESHVEGGIDKYLENLGLEYFNWHMNLESVNEIVFNLSSQQKKKFNHYFEDIQREYWAYQDDDIVSVIRRLGLIAFRIMMVFTALRMMENGEVSGNVECSDVDFENTLKMIETLVIHSSQSLKLINKKGKEMKKCRKDDFFDLLPKIFNRKTYLQLAANLGIPDKSAQRYIKDFIEGNILAREKFDHYIKVKEFSFKIEEMRK